MRGGKTNVGHLRTRGDRINVAVSVVSQKIRKGREPLRYLGSWGQKSTRKVMDDGWSRERRLSSACQLKAPAGNFHAMTFADRKESALRSVSEAAKGSR